MISKIWVSFHIKLHVLVGMKLYEHDLIGWQRVLWHIVKRPLCGSSDNIETDNRSSSNNHKARIRH